MFNNQTGLTLVELLATLTLSTMIVGIVSSVLITSMNNSEITQSHIDLRQEANIIVTQLRTAHQGDNYKLCYNNGKIYSDSNQNNIIGSENITVHGMSDVLFENDGAALNQTSTGETCLSVNTTVPLYVTLELGTDYNQEYQINTTINTLNASLPITLPASSQDLGDFLVDENVFVYGKKFVFNGRQINGAGATIVVKGDLKGSEIGGGSLSNVSNIYVGGSTTFDGGAAGLGSSSSPGNLHFNGDLTLWGGTRNIYGDVYVNGNFRLKDANIYGDVYVNGNIELGWTPSLSADSNIYYTGSLDHPDNYRQDILSKLVKQENVKSFTMPEYPIPPLKSDQWFANHGYTQTIKPEDMRLYGNNINIASYYDQNLGRYVSTFTNAIIVSKGDININSGGLQMTGVLFAPNGKVTFSGSSFEGLVIARDGYEVISGGTTVNFKSIQNYVSDPADYPFGSE